MFKETIQFIRQQFGTDDFIPLHAPVFPGNEKKYVMDAIDTTFVSSVGEYVNLFEQQLAARAGTAYAVATVNGTAALHIALLLAGVKPGEEVLSQSLTFIATINAITYAGGHPVFIDVDPGTMGMSPASLQKFLETNAEVRDGKVYNKLSGNRIAACLPMHTFGHPCEIDSLCSICDKWNIPVVEDAAESIGSYYKEMHTGGFGLMGTFSFNGNKTITCGGGGAIVTNDEGLAKMAKHLTTQAKVPHPWEFKHDHTGYNYRMPNLNAAMACAQLEQLDFFLRNKRALAESYKTFFESTQFEFVNEPAHSKANYWLCSILLKDKSERDLFLEFSNTRGVMCRPAWTLMNELPMFSDCWHDVLTNSINISNRLVNLPSSVRL
jgi:perosamine synthetase